MAEPLEPVLTLKRTRSISFSKCIVCQNTKSEKLLNASEHGFSVLKDAAVLRRKLRDSSNLDLLETISEISDNSTPSIVWHKSCYSSFTSKTHIARLSRKRDVTVRDEPHISSPSMPSTSRLRSSILPMNWNKCMFCQSDLNDKFSSVTTVKMSEQILQAAHFDRDATVRLSNVNDLIAAEGKYHHVCLKRFFRNKDNTRKSVVETKDVALQWLIEDLLVAAEQGKVLEISVVYDRYIDLAHKAGVEARRRTAFKDKLKLYLNDTYEFVVMRNRPSEERQVLLIPRKFLHVPIACMKDSDDTGTIDEGMGLPAYRPENDWYMEMIHVAMKVRSDIMEHEPFEGLDVSNQAAIACVPDSLYMFVNLVLSGSKLLDSQDDDSVNESNNNRVLSIAQDFVYNTSGGKRWTPKHIGLGCALHQATRSKNLVRLFNEAGHTIDYESVLRIDNCLAEETLKSMDRTSGAVVPPNLSTKNFVHFTCDNIDISDSNLDGKDSFHATQVAVWQRGNETNVGLKTLSPDHGSKSTTLEVPTVMEELIPANICEGKTENKYDSETLELQKTPSQSSPETTRANSLDMAYFILRQHEQNRPIGWTIFNEKLSSVNHELTNVGYLPFLLSPAHDIDTLNTVVHRCKYIANQLSQAYVVLTVDEALFCKLMDLKWSKPEYEEFLVVRLGGLHTAMNFLKVIGQHIQSSGLMESWVESGLVGPKAAEGILSGKNYSRGMRVHKITLQAMWRLLMPQLLDHIKNHDLSFIKKLNDYSNQDSEALVDFLEQDTFQQYIRSFLEEADNVNLKFWWGYMKMVLLLLKFTRAQRDGIWELHLSSFREMLPLFMWYDHTNYARWGTVYLAEMCRLPSYVLEEFKQGNFVVKRSCRAFSEVDPDQSQEWLNATGKKRGGIVGITRTPTALSRWTLSFNLRSHISCDTLRMFNMDDGNGRKHNEANKSRQTRDLSDEDKLYEAFVNSNLFSNDRHELQNFLTKDVATASIQDSLLNSKEKGEIRLQEFVKERLLVDGSSGLRAPLSKNKPLTFSSLFEVSYSSSEKTQRKILKADRSILQRLVIALDAGREVDLSNVLSHELLPVPIAISEMGGSLRSGNKSELTKLLTGDLETPSTLDKHDPTDSVLIIDGQALVVGMGKPKDAVTFGDLAERFCANVISNERYYGYIHVIFDRYYEDSIKSGTRIRRGKGLQPVRRVIESCDVPLPSDWKNFLGLPENKIDYARFLSCELVKRPSKSVIVAAGGFLDEERVDSNNSHAGVEDLRARHEEADTRIIFHCQSVDAGTIVVQARDTDILVLLVSHFMKMKCNRLWLKAGTSKHRQYIPVHDIVQELESQHGLSIIENLTAFHALTGSDVTSFFLGQGKKKAWKVYKIYSNLVERLGCGEFDDSTLRGAEQFVCRLYGSDSNSINEVRRELFLKLKSPDNLPPSFDALEYHIRRAHYQASLWRQAACAYPLLPQPEQSGWNRSEGKLIPILMTLPPVPTSCIELVFCGCSACSTMRCSCRKARLPCTSQCRCSNNMQCVNRI